MRPLIGIRKLRIGGRIVHEYLARKLLLDCPLPKKTKKMKTMMEMDKKFPPLSRPWSKGSAEVDESRHILLRRVMCISTP